MLVKTMESLFDQTWFPDTGSIVLTVFYFPFGIALVIIRLFITLHALLVSCILPKSAASSFVMKTMFDVIGIHVVVQEDGRKKSGIKPKVIVTNHISKIDHMVVDFIQPCLAPDEVGLSSFVRWLFAYRDFGKAKGTDILENNIRDYVKDAKIPLIFQPEKTTTNGSGLLKFDIFPFSLQVPVLPVAIQATRWPLKVPMSTLQSTRISEFLWALFFPYTIYKIKILEPETQKEDESLEDFTGRIQERLASSLNIVTTQFTVTDKMDYLKKVLADKARREREAAQRIQNSTRGNGWTQSAVIHSQKPSPEVEAMAAQVRDVLPDASLTTIIKDLEITQDVDTTITNILEGKVTEVKTPDLKSSPQTNQVRYNSDICASQQKYGASTFSRSPSDRQLSLSERKTIMLATARQRYKEKHGLI